MFFVVHVFRSVFDVQRMWNHGGGINGFGQDMDNARSPFDGLTVKDIVNVCARA